jgi:Domain of unknown function (DUF4259)
MGAREVGNFANDDASDWVYDLEGSSGTELLVEAITAVEHTDYADSPDCCIALAAAEAIAAANEHPAEDLPEGVLDWVEKQDKAAIRKLAPRMAKVVRKLQMRSELKDLWEESDNWHEWQQVVEGLLRRLKT